MEINVYIGMEFLQINLNGRLGFNAMLSLQEKRICDHNVGVTKKMCHQIQRSLYSIICI